MVCGTSNDSTLLINSFVSSAFGFEKISYTDPSSTTRPSCMTAIRSQISLTTFISCVINTIVIFNSRFIFFSNRRIDRVVFGSSAEVASSHNNKEGSFASARAIPTRCFCPPLSCAGNTSFLSVKPTISRSSTTREANFSLGVFSALNAKAIFSATVF